VVFSIFAICSKNFDLNLNFFPPTNVYAKSDFVAFVCTGLYSGCESGSGVSVLWIGFPDPDQHDLDPYFVIKDRMQFQKMHCIDAKKLQNEHTALLTKYFCRDL
jgi:hypothetical protein